MSGRNADPSGTARQASVNSRDSGGRFRMRGLNFLTVPVGSKPAFARDPLAWALALLGVIVVGCTAWWISGLGDAALGRSLTGAAAIPGGIIVTLLAVRIWRARDFDPRTRRAWLIIYLALVLYALGAAMHF